MIAFLGVISFLAATVSGLYSLNGYMWDWVGVPIALQIFTSAVSALILCVILDY